MLNKKALKSTANCEIKWRSACRAAIETVCSATNEPKPIKYGQAQALVYDTHGVAIFCWIFGIARCGDHFETKS